MGMEFTGWFHVFCFQALTFNTPFNVVAYVVSNAQPPVVPGDHFPCFVLSWMSRHDGIVVLLYDVASEFSVYRYVDPIFPCDYPIVSFRPFWVFVVKGFGD